MNCNNPITTTKHLAKRKRKFCCHKCFVAYAKKKTTDKERLLKRRLKEIYFNAKRRALEKGVFFSLEKDFVKDFPLYCPVLGIKLNWEVGTGYDNSPSLDRINSNLGYTPNNIRIISHRANRLKSNAKSEEMFLILKDLIKNGL